MKVGTRVTTHTPCTPSLHGRSGTVDGTVEEGSFIVVRLDNDGGRHAGLGVVFKAHELSEGTVDG